ncbi:hypothetical protein FJV48_01510 [Citrobacter freundii]|nr:hypothetical protein [Citrobacter freundii]
MVAIIRIPAISNAALLPREEGVFVIFFSYRQARRYLSVFTQWMNQAKMTVYRLNRTFLC